MAHSSDNRVALLNEVTKRNATSKSGAASMAANLVRAAAACLSAWLGPRICGWGRALVDGFVRGACQTPCVSGLRTC